MFNEVVAVVVIVVFPLKGFNVVFNAVVVVVVLTFETIKSLKRWKEKVAQKRDEKEIQEYLIFVTL